MHSPKPNFLCSIHQGPILIVKGSLLIGQTGTLADVSCALCRTKESDLLLPVSELPGSWAGVENG